MTKVCTEPVAATPALIVDVDDPARPDVFALLEEHLRNMRELSPPESVHALDVTGLQQPDVTFFAVRDGEGTLLGCGALKELDPRHGEVKSMRTPQSARRLGAGRAVLGRIVQVARRRDYRRLSLETGSMDAFRPAWRLYESFGFRPCGPFADYVPDPNSVFMTLEL
jgi:putative acetyltransferase